MTVYVDAAIHSYGRMIMCHMWADTLPELLAMVDAIGVDHRWLQQPPHASWVHFDISKGKRAEAIRLGAVETDRYGPVEHVARIDIASGDPDRILRGTAKIASLERIRAKRRATAMAERDQGDLFA